MKQIQIPEKVREVKIEVEKWQTIQLLEEGEAVRYFDRAFNLTVELIGVTLETNEIETRFKVSVTAIHRHSSMTRVYQTVLNFGTIFSDNPDVPFGVGHSVRGFLSSTSIVQTITEEDFTVQLDTAWEEITRWRESNLRFSKSKTQSNEADSNT